MWCRNCNIELNDKKCPVCGSDTVDDIPVEIHWCSECKVPVLQEVSQADKGVCPRCGNKMKYMSSDIRPVFPEERLLLEILLDRKPNEYIEKSVWAVNSRYYIDGKSVSLPSSLFRTADSDDIARKLEAHKKDYNYEFFNEIIKRFVE
ncbi:MAG: phosphoadenosine phosphosulfate reductase, partial [Lachnospiraceae bacterium]|nr:phosphoadenosine phosphosulfate reductase [Lachnospiraceae bacterium]